MTAEAVTAPKREPSWRRKYAAVGTVPLLSQCKDYTPRGAAKKLMSTRNPEVLLEGPAGTGKTMAMCVKAAAIAEKYAQSRLLFVRKTRESLTQSVLVTFEDKVLPEDHPARAGPSRQMRQSYRWPNGSEIVIGGLDKESRIMSSEYDVICAFEATELTESEWETLSSRLRNHKVPYQQIIADTNPGAPSHWLNRRAESDRMVRLLSRHEDNPSLTPEYIERLKALTGVRYLRLYKGVWAAAEGMVYDNYDPAVHQVERFEIPADWQRIRSIDFGYTNPFVCQWWALDGDGRMYLYRELYATRCLVEDMAPRIIALSEGERIEATIADHDAEGRATLERHGIGTVPAFKAVGPGIEAVQVRFRTAGDGRPRIFFLRDSLIETDGLLLDGGKPCSTVQEIESYVWPRSADGRPEKEEPVKEYDHGMDAMRYTVAYVDQIADGRLDLAGGLDISGPTLEERQWREAV